MQRFISAELLKKADTKAVDRLADATAALQRSYLEGEFTPAQANAIDKRIDLRLDARTDSSWTSRERRIAVAMMLLTLASCLATIALTFHSIFPKHVG